MDDRTQAAVRALAQATANECAKRGGKAYTGPDGLLHIEASVDPFEIVREITKALDTPS